MRISVPAEIKNNEIPRRDDARGACTHWRGGATQVAIQAGAGIGAGYYDAEYLAAGALRSSTPAAGGVGRRSSS